MIECTSLTRDFENVRAVDSVSFQVPNGSIVALLGPNGAGKTTTARMLCGLLSISSGSASIDEIDVVARPDLARQRAGLVMGDANLYGSMKLLDYLTFFGEAYGLSRKAARQRAIQGAGELGLEASLNSVLSTFSRGMKQRVGLARSLIHKPSALLLDEPTNGLDPEAAFELRGRIKEFKAEGLSILLCSHLMPEVEELADFVLVINKGRIVAQQTTDGLKSGDRAKRFRVHLSVVPKKCLATLSDLSLKISLENGFLVYETDNPQKINAEIIRRLVGIGAEITSISEVERTLEEAYLEIVRE